MKDMLDRLAGKGDELLTQLTNELITSSAFTVALERLIRTKGMVERQVRLVLNTMSVASLSDIEELGDQVRRLTRDMRRLEKRLQRLEEQPAGEAEA